MLIRSLLVTLSLLTLVSCAGRSVSLPETPKDAILVRDEPILCEQKVYYLHVYDTNPSSGAFTAIIGPSDREHKHGQPFLIIIADDAKNLTFYVSVDGAPVEKMTREEFEKRYGPGISAVCSLGASRRTEIQ